MIGYFLVFLAMAQLDEIKPNVIAPFKTYDECAKAAQMLNATDPDVKTPEGLKMGKHWACLKLMGDA